jgi:hypothetical protein
MKKVTSLVSSLPLVLGVLLFSNCATVFQEGTQFVPVTSTPAFATVSVNGKKMGETPFYLTLKRSEKKQVIRIESPGYDPYEIRVKRTAKGGYVLADGLAGAAVGGAIAATTSFSDADEISLSQFVIYGLLSAAVFVGIDAAVGKGYTLEPKELVVTLQKAGGTPRVDTILIDADDFQNVKWIRVHRD